MQKNWGSLPLTAVVFGNMALLGFIGSMKGVSFPLIKNNFGVSYNDMGLMTALFSFCSVFFSLAAGLYMNRFGLKKIIVTAFCLIMTGVGALYFASSFWMTAGLYLILQSGLGFLDIGLNGTGVRVFTKRSGLMLNLLHFFYGAGAIAGPRFMGVMITRAGFSWQEVYPLAIVAALILLSVTLAIRFPSGAGSSVKEEKPSFLDTLKDPVVWLFGLIMGTSGSIEGCSVAWSGLYLQDVYGLDPGTAGALFVSVFYGLYTLSRLLSGFAIERIGLLKSVLVSGALIFVILAAAFSLGRTGIYLLPLVGFFVAVMWPTLLAITVKALKEKAQIASSAMIAIAAVVNGIIQYGFGLSNRFLGAAWGYRSCVLYSVVLFILLCFLKKQNKIKGWNVR